MSCRLHSHTYTVVAGTTVLPSLPLRKFRNTEVLSLVMPSTVIRILVFVPSPLSKCSCRLAQLANKKHNERYANGSFTRLIQPWTAQPSHTTRVPDSGPADVFRPQNMLPIVHLRECVGGFSLSLSMGAHVCACSASLQYRLRFWVKVSANCPFLFLPSDCS